MFERLSTADLTHLVHRLDFYEARSRPHWSSFTIRLARIPTFRNQVIRIVCRIEGGEMWSRGFRELMRRYHAVDIGRYSYGSSLWSGAFPPGTRIGHYCSLAGGIEVFRRNHPSPRLSLHPLFYNAACGLVTEDTIPPVTSNPLEIGHDTWLGANAIITPRCCRIGIGSVVGAGAVVTADVPNFSIVAGNPARLIRKRFSDEICSVLLDSCWWNYRIQDLVAVLPLFLADATIETAKQLREHLRDCQPVDRSPN